jgi:hypothetical protein
MTNQILIQGGRSTSQAHQFYIQHNHYYYYYYHQYHQYHQYRQLNDNHMVLCLSSIFALYSGSNNTKIIRLTNIY